MAKPPKPEPKKKPKLHNELAQQKYGSLAFAQAISQFRQKLSMPTARWQDIWGDAHNQAFMVAGAMKQDLLKDLRGAVDDAIARGMSLNQFQKQFTAIASKHGWDHTGQAPWRARVIYDTNMRQSYNAGREAQMLANQARRPYGLYRHGDSLNPREQHLKWHDLVLPLDDPWWQTHSPSNGYGCKCKKYSLSEADLKRRGLKISGSPSIEYRDYIDKATGEVIPVPKGIDPGFEYKPTAIGQLKGSASQAKATTKPKAKQKTPHQSDAIGSSLSEPRFIDSVFSTTKGVEAKGLSNLLEQLPQEQQGLLKGFIDAKQTKTLFLKQTELGKGKRANGIKEDVAAYLNLDTHKARHRYYTSRATRTNGFTAKSWEHVVVKTSAKTQFKKVDMAKVTQAAEEVVITARTNKGGDRFLPKGAAAEAMQRHWSVSHRVNQLAGEGGRVLTTWAHEIGHQIHFWGGEIELARFGYVSRYGMTNNYEVFAEWFAAWLLAPDEVARFNPSLAKAIVDTVKRATQSAAKGA